MPASGRRHGGGPRDAIRRRLAGRVTAQTGAGIGMRAMLGADPSPPGTACAVLSTSISHASRPSPKGDVAGRRAQ